MHAESTYRAGRRVLHVASLGAALLVGIVGFSATAHAQNLARIKIDFAFVVAGKEMPAGAYEFEAAPGRVVVRPSQGNATPAMLPIITRLGRHDADTDPELIFDKVDGKLVLSELWLPNSDGYLLTNTPGDHEHRVLGGSRPHK